MVYKECHKRTDDYCKGGDRIPGDKLRGLESGCFCPDNQLLVEKYKDICVTNCPYCKGPRGEPKQFGETWESKCHICTCSNITQTEECTPKQPQPTPTCKEKEILVTYNSTDCCEIKFCVEKTCEYNETTYKVGDTWKDPSQPCQSYSCAKSGITVERKVCPEVNCAEGQKIWDEAGCCFTCNDMCEPKKSTVKLQDGNCTADVEMTACEGQCESTAV
ncbi:apomucin-like [Amia ocellicauda]|uniref:apomucin-like n=1 Tax=Amia ocellicauda TaxID=2972642 RepID=UPI0034638C7A